jgi:hypothetical protein
MIDILITIVVIGLIVWIVKKFIPMAEPFATIFNVVVAIVAILWLLKVLPTLI